MSIRFPDEFSRQMATHNPMEAPRDRSRPHCQGHRPLQPGRRLPALLVFLLLGVTVLAGCLAPSGGQSMGDCPPEPDLPEPLPKVKQRTSDDGHQEVQDATGVWTELDNHSRIVATSHDLVELLFLMGHGERLVAVPNWIDHPPGPHPEGIEGLQRLGRPHVIPAEDVRAVDPTLVLDKPHPLQPTPLATSLRNAGLDVVVFDEQETLASLAETYAMLAAVLEPVDEQAPAKAQAQWDALHQEIADIQGTVRAHVTRTGTDCPLVLYMFPANLAAGEGTAAGLVLELAGARNLAAQAGLEGYRTLSREALLSGDPQRIVGTTTGGLPSPNSPRWIETQAAQYGSEAFLPVDPATTGLPGPRFPEGARLIAEWLHPTAFGHITPHVKTATQTDDEGSLTFTLDATSSIAQNGTLTYRFLPGDESEAQTSQEGRFTHTYPAGTRTTAHLLLIDGQGRMHTEKHSIEATS